jgi:hypothetical protein
MVAVFAVLLGWVPPVHAQSFTSGSNGSDGALSITVPGAYDFYPGNSAIFSSPVDIDGDNVYHFTSITIGAGVTVQLDSSRLNARPVYWLASGPVQIDGSIDLSGQGGHSAMAGLAGRSPSSPGPGGYPGGVGGLNLQDQLILAKAGHGPGGGSRGMPGRDALYATGDDSYGNIFLVPLLGGSGGGGGDGGGIGGGGGGAGGGALLVASSEVIAIDGNIRANGGAGGKGSPLGGSLGSTFGGDGSGGAIHLKAPIVNGTGVLTALRGAGTLQGGSGRIRVEAFEHQFTGTSKPSASLASPSPVFLSTNAPSVRVVSVSGVPVPANPTGEFTPADVSINAGAASTVEIEAHNIPLGTVVQIHVFSENQKDTVWNSEPLAGTLASSSATVTVTFPHGFSRAFPRAAWQNQ